MINVPQSASSSTEVYGWETKSAASGKYFESHVKIPVDVVYGESGEGIHGELKGTQF